MGHYIPYAIAILFMGLVLWAHVSTIVHVVRENKKDKKVPVLSKVDATAIVDGVSTIIQAKYCPKCTGSLRQEIFLGMKLYRCSQGHSFVERGKGRLTSLEVVGNIPAYRN